MAWFGNDIGGYAAQSIINGTNKINREPREEFVYLVFDENHGLQCVCGTKERADKELDYLAKQYEVQNEPLDYIGLSRKGWDGACWWDKVQVIN